jgi:hypothetical protein
VGLDPKRVLLSAQRVVSQQQEQGQRTGYLALALGAAVAIALHQRPVNWAGGSCLSSSKRLGCFWVLICQSSKTRWGYVSLFEKFSAGVLR